MELVGWLVSVVSENDDRQFQEIHSLADLVLLTASSLVMHSIMYRNAAQNHYDIIIRTVSHFVSSFISSTVVT
jgi:hypothetical protein